MLVDAAALGALLAIVAPVFAIILIGYVIGRLGLFSSDQVRAFGRLVILVVLPALIFNALATAKVGEVFRLDYLIVYGLASLAVFALGFAWFRLRGGGRSNTAGAAVRALGMSNSNTAFVGLPVLIQIFGQAAAGPAALNLLFENMLLLPLVIALVEAGQGDHGHPFRAAVGIGRNLLRSSMIWAMVLGALVALSGLALPQPVMRTVGMLAGASGPLALLTIGASLAGVSLRGRFSAVASISLGKLVVHPLLVLLVLQAIPIADPMFRTSALLLASMPMLSIFPVLAQRTGDAETCSAALLVATAASFVTLVAAIGLLGMQLG